VFGFGYAFCAQAVEEPAQAVPAFCEPGVLAMGERDFELRQGDNMIGRAADCLVRIPSPRVSRRHAVIRMVEACATIEDLGSKNGTLVSGERIRGSRLLQDGDEIVIAGVVLRFRTVRPSDPTLSDLE
ncbi:MAG: FHA domain-containing protein, partial [Dongiaceae bacterium]